MNPKTPPVVLKPKQLIEPTCSCFLRSGRYCIRRRSGTGGGVRMVAVQDESDFRSAFSCSHGGVESAFDHFSSWHRRPSFQTSSLQFLPVDPTAWPRKAGRQIPQIAIYCLRNDFVTFLLQRVNSLRWYQYFFTDFQRGDRFRNPSSYS